MQYRIALIAACIFCLSPVQALRLAAQQHRSRPIVASETAGAQLVWLTGAEDLRLHDHGGFTVAAAADGDGAVVPVFVFDPAVHLKYSAPRLARLHEALSSLEQTLAKHSEVPLIIRKGKAAEILPQLVQDCGATTCHLIADDVEAPMREAQRAGCAALEASGVSVRRWESSLRSAPWSVAGEASRLPCTFPAYAAAAATNPLQAPLGVPEEEMAFLIPFLPATWGRG